MTSAKRKLFIICAVLAAAAAALLVQRRAGTRLREENQALKVQAGELARLTTENERLSNSLASLSLADGSLSVPPMLSNSLSAESQAEDTSLTNVIARIFHGGQPPYLTVSQLESYLDQHHRSAGSLLIAYRTTRDLSLLKEAKENYPNDPMVAFDAVCQNDVSPEERHQWLETFKRLAPDNALPDYLAALDHFKAGETDQAMQELNLAAGKQHFQEYSLDFVQNGEEAYRAAGYSEAEAKTFASMGLMLPELRQAKELGVRIGELVSSYRQSGDEASAQALAALGDGLGRRFQDAPGQTVIGQLVGAAVERLALGALDPARPYGDNGQTVQDRLNEVTAQREALKELSNAENFLQNMPDRDIISYWDRWRTFGSQPAFQWAVTKYGQK